MRAFLRGYVAAMHGAYDITVVTTTTDVALFDGLGGTVRLIPMAIERGISLRKDLFTLVRMTRLFRQERFDLIHSITPKAGLLAMVGGVMARTPVRIHTFTGQVWATRRGLSRLLLKNLDRLMAASATFALVDSASQRDFLRREGVVAADKTMVIGHGSVGGVDGRRFHPDVEVRRRLREALGIGADDLVLLFVGRLQIDKGVLDLASAFKQVAEARPDVRLLIVGPDEQQLRPRLIAAAGLHADRVHFVGTTAEPESFMAASDVLCLPSYREGFGSVIIEAAAVGLPAVASRIYGIVDAMDDGRTGLGHPPRDVAAIVAVLLRILSDTPLRDRLGAAARQRALSEFAEATVTMAIVDLYKRLIGRLPLGVVSSLDESPI